MRLPDTAQEIINTELRRLAGGECAVERQRRFDLYSALGPSNVSDKEIVEQARESTTLPELTTADRARTRIALTTARKVEPLWEEACRETDANFEEHNGLLEIQRAEAAYLERRKQKAVENISPYDVPRRFVPSHILEMAELVLNRNVSDHAAFRHAANEWWEIHPRPERMERECFIKWAAQEALYEGIGWTRFMRDESSSNEFDAPAGFALFAYAGIVEGKDFWGRSAGLDEHKQREFWYWWLTEAIPTAWVRENE